MHINVAQLLKEPIGSSRSYHIEEHVERDDINFVSGDIILIRTNRGIIVRGKITASVKGICSRCLKPIVCKVKYDFDEEALPGVTGTEGLSSEGQYDNLIIDEDHTLDLSEAIRQYALLAVPAKPLCRLDCAGICPKCGHDLNQKLCQCPSSIKDQRWSELIGGKENKN
ncbi:MAG: DUF177 domain-containing protein [Dehalococcoidia bacterium]|nr:DUF177 domain-containing protein [Dehalococcoidia bacterium]